MACINMKYSLDNYTTLYNIRNWGLIYYHCKARSWKCNHEDYLVMKTITSASFSNLLITCILFYFNAIFLLSSLVIIIVLPILHRIPLFPWALSCSPSSKSTNKLTFIILYRSLLPVSVISYSFVGKVRTWWYYIAKNVRIISINRLLFVLYKTEYWSIR